MKLYLTAFLVIGCLGGHLVAQTGDLEYTDKTYVSFIASVQFHVTGLLTSYPIVRLGSMGALTLSFDDLDADSKYYNYTIIHCDKEWRPSRLDFTEYVNGFNGEEVRSFARSINTLVPFTHYTLQFPNANLEITKTGNYLLVIFLDDPAYPVITRRFMVTDSKVNIRAVNARPANVSKIRTHQEIDFEVSVEYLGVRDPKNDVYAVVLQNGRWDNAITGIKSRFERGNKMDYDYQDEITFPAGFDFRNADIRSTQYRSRDVFEITRENGRNRIILETDEPRALRNFHTDVDINGQYVIRSTDAQRYSAITTINEDALGQLVEEKSVVSLTQHNLEADYVDVMFTLKTDRRYDSDVYLFGRFTDWRLQEKYKLTWDDRYGAYFALVPLKQGFYDYIYVLANADGTPDESTIENNWYEATNDYTILIYHTPFGSRYDQLVGAYTFPSYQ